MKIRADINHINKLKKKFPVVKEEIIKFVIDKEKYFSKMNEETLEKFGFNKGVGYIFMDKIKDFIIFINEDYQSKNKILEEKKLNSLNILKDKNLWKRIVFDELDKKIVGEYDAREIIFMCAMGKLVKNCASTSYNLLMHSESTAGKDYVTKNILEIIPKSSVCTRTRISPTVLNYWKPYESKGQDSWDGSILYLPDAGESILNSDAMKLMCSDGSHITITDKGEAKDIEILGKPVIFITTANSTPNEEILNRFSIVKLNETMEHTRKIFEIQARRAITGESDKYDNKIIEAIYFLERVEVKIPYADKIVKVFPYDKLRERRNFERFLDYIKCSAAIHQYQRKKKGEFIEAIGQDYDLARRIFKHIQCGVGSIPINGRQKEIVNVLKDFEEPLSLSEIHSKLKTYIAMKNLRPHLDSLVNLKIVDTQYVRDTFGKELQKYTLSEEYFGFKPIELPKFEDLKLLGGKIK